MSDYVTEVGDLGDTLEVAYISPSVRAAMRGETVVVDKNVNPQED